MNDGWEPQPNPVARIIGVRTAQTTLPALAALFGVGAYSTALAWQATPYVGAATIVGLSAYFATVFAARSSFGFPLLSHLPESAGDAIALTLDDGPHPDTTPSLLKILTANDAKATFFLVAERAAAYPDLTRAIAESGHTIGVHGRRHRAMVLSSAAEIARDLTECEQIFAALLGSPLPSRYLRPPHGFKTPTLCRTAARLGWSLISWSLDPRDYDSPPLATLTARLTAARPRDIVLLHERPADPATNALALQTTLPQWRQRGLRCIALMTE